MLKVFSSILDIIVSFINFFVSMLTSLINFVSKIPTYVVFLTSSISLVPSILIPFLLASVSISVVLFMIGRNK